MGNYISCTLYGNIGIQSKGAKVFLPNGEIRKFDQHVNAAEVMLENPNHFLVNSSALQIGRRFSALSADEDLDMGNIYVAFPMRRVNSVITAADMGRFFVTANSAVRRASGGKTRILPESGESVPVSESVREGSVPRLNLEEVEDFSMGEFKHRLSVCRSRKPLLETIAEETVGSR